MSVEASGHIPIIECEQLKQLLAAGAAQLVEELPRAECMRNNLQTALVTTAEGQLVGLVHRNDAECHVTAD